jgi:peptide/nickel transport system permease protein
LARFLLSRLVQAIVVLWGVATIVFVLVHLSGDPARLMLPPNATEEQVVGLRHQLGLDRPLPEQYVDFLGRLARGDLGVSIRLNQPVLRVLLERVPATIQLTLASLLVSVAVALPLGTLSAAKRDTAIDGFSSLVALLGQSLPTFWLGIVLILLFAVKWQIFPALGAGTPAHLVLPSITLGAYSAALTTRILRSSLLDVLDHDFVRTARAKGLRERLVLARHVAPNAAAPVLTVLALQVGLLLSGAIVTETVFNYPGMGLLVVQAIFGRDFTLVQGFVVLLALVIVAINLAVDVVYSVLDPRIRFG